MSHFAVLVIGENPEEQLKPFDENLKIEFKDETEEHRKEYETEYTSEFYCNSHSSWGQEITKELFETLKTSKIGSVIEYEIKKRTFPGQYFKKHLKYRGYYTLENHKRCKGSQWFEVEDILNTDIPDGDACFEGKILIRKITSPKRIALKDKYPIYEDYLKHYHGTDNSEKQGYYFNPQAKWDWYQLGGRWTGFFTLKLKSNGKLGEPSLVSERRVNPGTADQAYKKDIDFEKMRQNNFEDASKRYDEFENLSKEKTIDAGAAYFDYGIRNIAKNSKKFIPEPREEFIKRHAPVITFAVVKDGKWYERGEMGWWGIVSDEKNTDEWNEQFTKLIEEQSDDTLLSLFDCHI